MCHQNEIQFFFIKFYYQVETPLVNIGVENMTSLFP
jgi:hypothetical protein